MQPRALRLRRDFPTIRALIDTHAIRHQATRERDANGNIVATLDDYTAIHDLVADLINIETGVEISDAVRETVAMVAHLLDDRSDRRSDGRSDGDNHLTLNQLAVVAGLDVSTIHRRVNLAIRDGYLRNLETRTYRPYKIVLGDAIPGRPSPVLPTPEQLRTALQPVQPPNHPPNRRPRLQRPTR